MDCNKISDQQKEACVHLYSQHIVILNMGLVLISSLFSLIFIFQNVFKMQTNNCIETVHKARHWFKNEASGVILLQQILD